MMRVFNKIIREIHNAGGCAGSCEYDKGWDDAIREAEGIVEKVAVNYVNRWIPVEKRLPDGEKRNPITDNAYVYPVTADFNGVRDIRYYSFWRGHWYNGPEPMDEHVIAWMPLPEIYEA